MYAKLGFKKICKIGRNYRKFQENIFYFASVFQFIAAHNKGQLWIKIFPDKPITKKPLEVRMGKGKGAVEYWVSVVKPGKIMFEVGGVPYEVAKEALRLAAQKLPVTTKFVVANDFVQPQ